MPTEYRAFGAPGTGKTTYLARQIVRAVDKYGPDSIIISSFTRAAAKELVNRDLPVNENLIGTLHAHCFRHFNNPTIAESKIKEFNEFAPEYAMSNVRVDVTESAVDQNYKTPSDENFATYQILRNRLVDRRAWPQKVEALAKAWENWKLETGYYDFTDLIETAQIDMPPPGPFSRIGIFDEVQDFTPLQLQLIRKWSENLEFVILAGDDDQTLYSFAGATPDAFLKPSIPDNQKIILPQSYRVPKAIHRFASMLIEQVHRREKKVYKPTESEGVLKLINSNYKTPDRIASCIEEKIASGKSVMILGACSYMLQGMLRSLRMKALPFWNPYKTNRGDWNPLTPGSGMSTKERIVSYLFPTGPTFGNVRLWTPSELVKWIELIKAEGVLARGGKKEITQQANNKDMTAEDLLRLMTSCFTEQGLNEAVKCDMSWLERRIVGSKVNSARFPMDILRKRGRDVLDAKPSITIGTIHSVKGGEADVVYLFPDLSIQAMQQYINTREGRDAVMRQFYVGITRAKEELYITQPSNMGSFVKELSICPA